MAAITFVEVLQAAVNAASPDSRGRGLVVQRVLQQLGMVVQPEVTRTRDGLVYTWRTVPLLGDLVLNADGKLSTPTSKAPIVADPSEAPMRPVSWATSFRSLREQADPAALRAALRAAVPLLLSALP